MANKDKTWSNKDTVIDSEGRTCMTCGTYKPYEQYHLHSNCANGYNTVCKQCRKVTSKKNYKALSLEQNIFNRAKSRAAKRNIEFNLELSDIVVPDMCPVLNIPITKGKIGGSDNSPSIDRTDSNKGYVKGNITIMSNRANVLKNNATYKELVKVAEYVKACEVVDLI